TGAGRSSGRWASETARSDGTGRQRGGGRWWLSSSALRKEDMDERNSVQQDTDSAYTAVGQQRSGKEASRRPLCLGAGGAVAIRTGVTSPTARHAKVSIVKRRGEIGQGRLDSGTGAGPDEEEERLADPALGGVLLQEASPFARDQGRLRRLQDQRVGPRPQVC